ncbi:MAG: hypothetical protein WDN45_02610 [Caulobacteraceae bacterium]
MISQILTLFSTPVIYFYLDKVRRRFEKDDHSSRAKVHGSGAPAAAKELTLGGE